MTINAAKIKRKAREEREANKRGRVSLYLNLRLYKKFKQACGKEPASTIMEMLMQEFIDNNRS